MYILHHSENVLSIVVTHFENFPEDLTPTPLAVEDTLRTGLPVGPVLPPLLPPAGTDLNDGGTHWPSNTFLALIIAGFLKEGGDFLPIQTYTSV